MSSSEWVKFRASLTKGAKRSLPRATRFIFLELALLARDRSGEILLAPGMTDVDAVHDLLGGNRREVADAMRHLGTALPGDEEPLISFVDDGGARYLVIPSWNRENAPPKEKPGASTDRSRRHRANANATTVASPLPEPLPTVATVTQRSGDDRSSGEESREEKKRERAREGAPANSAGSGGDGRKQRKTSSAPAESEVDAWLDALGVPSRSDPRWGREVSRWLDHHRAKGSRFVDWAAAWRTWRSRSEDYGARDSLFAASHGAAAEPPAPPKPVPGTGRLPPPMPTPERVTPWEPVDNPVLRALGAKPVPPRVHGSAVRTPDRAAATEHPSSSPSAIGDLLAGLVQTQPVPERMDRDTRTPAREGGKDALLASTRGTPSPEVASARPGGTA